MEATEEETLGKRRKFPPGLTATERRLWDVLRDGMPHSRGELRACINDEFAVESCLRMHLSNVRRKIRPRRDIMPCYPGPGRALHYRLVRLINQP